MVRVALSFEVDLRSSRSLSARPSNWVRPSIWLTLSARSKTTFDSTNSFGSRPFAFAFSAVLNVDSYSASMPFVVVLEMRGERRELPYSLPGASQPRRALGT